MIYRLEALGEQHLRYRVPSTIHGDPRKRTRERRNDFQCRRGMNQQREMLAFVPSTGTLRSSHLANPHTRSLQQWRIVLLWTVQLRSSHPNAFRHPFGFRIPEFCGIDSAKGNFRDFKRTFRIQDRETADNGNRGCEEDSGGFCRSRASTGTLDGETEEVGEGFDVWLEGGEAAVEVDWPSVVDYVGYTDELDESFSL